MAYKRLKSGKSISSEKAAELSLCAKEEIFEAVRNQFVETMKISAEFGEITDEITANGYSVLRISHDLCDYYGAVSGKGIFENRKTEIVSFVKTLCNTARPVLMNKGFSLICRIPEESVFVNIDRERFCYAVLNIILNAMENTPEGGRIRIGIQKTKKFAKVIIGDNGRGMDEETLLRCTEPFYSASSGKRKKMGLGLTLAHHFAAESGGRMNIKSEKGKGTTAEMLLPVIAAGEAELSASVIVPDIPGGKLSPVYIVLSGI